VAEYSADISDRIRGFSVSVGFSVALAFFGQLECWSCLCLAEMVSCILKYQCLVRPSFSGRKLNSCCCCVVGDYSGV